MHIFFHNVKNIGIVDRFTQGKTSWSLAPDYRILGRVTTGCPAALNQVSLLGLVAVGPVHIGKNWRGDC